MGKNVTAGLMIIRIISCDLGSWKRPSAHLCLGNQVWPLWRRIAWLKYWISLIFLWSYWTWLCQSKCEHSLGIGLQAVDCTLTSFIFIQIKKAGFLPRGWKSYYNTNQQTNHHVWCQFHYFSLAPLFQMPTHFSQKGFFNFHGEKIFRVHNQQNIMIPQGQRSDHKIRCYLSILLLMPFGRISNRLHWQTVLLKSSWNPTGWHLLILLLIYL